MPWGAGSSRKLLRADLADPEQGDRHPSSSPLQLGDLEGAKGSFQERLWFEGPRLTAELPVLYPQLSCPSGKGSPAPPPDFLPHVTLMRLPRRSLIKFPSVTSQQHLQPSSGTSVSSVGVEAQNLGRGQDQQVLLGSRLLPRAPSRYLDHRLSCWEGTWAPEVPHVSPQSLMQMGSQLPSLRSTCWTAIFSSFRLPYKVTKHMLCTQHRARSYTGFKNLVRRQD